MTRKEIIRLNEIRKDAIRCRDDVKKQIPIENITNEEIERLKFWLGYWCGRISSIDTILL